MSFSARLVRETEPERSRFMTVPALAQGSAGNVTREAYLEFLAQAYHHVRHTVPLFEACAGRLPARLEWLREPIADYIVEEAGHDQWILDDIAHAGGDAEAVRRGPPAPATEIMIAYAYDTIARVNPIGLFGMVLVLEGTSVNLALRAADALQAALGLPDEALTYLRSHGALDQEHMQGYARIMDRVSDPEDQRCIVHAARMFYRLYGDVFRALPVH